MFGRESKGLTNDELDRCHTLVSIATNPHYKSLNLAQAVSIVAYECWMAREGDDQARKPPRHDAEPATSAQYDHLFADWERALWAIEFFKTRRAESVMRSCREVIFRSALDGREATLVRAIGLEVVRFLERKGVQIPAAARKSGEAQGPPPPPV